MLKSLPNINLINEKNKKVRFHDLVKGKLIVLNMFYSECKIKCIPLGKLFKRVNILLHDYILKENIEFISITLDALNDTVEDLNIFKEKVYDDACLNWHFYTGKYKDIEMLRYKLGMYSPEPEIDKIKSNHSGGFLIFNEKTGFTKHTESFDNPVDVARKVIQMISSNLYNHYYDLNNLKFDLLTDEEIFENIKSMNSMFTVPFLPEYIRKKYDIYAEKQRGFQYVPPIIKNNRKTCCCKNNKQ